MVAGIRVSKVVNSCNAWASDRARDVAKPVLEAVQETIRGYVKDVAEVAATLEPGTEDCTDREEKFETIIDRFERTNDPIRHHMVVVMLSFLPGLFVGEGKKTRPTLLAELERRYRESSKS